MMVEQFGMSERLGPVAFGRKQQLVFLGRNNGERQSYSEEVGQMIDDGIRCPIDGGYARASRILSDHRALLDRLTAELIRSRDARRVGRQSTIAVRVRPDDRITVVATLNGTRVASRGRSD
jgi:ATP-dependent Zn protease